MQRREPNRADLVEAGLAGIKNATADVEVRLGIAVVKNVPPLKEPEGEPGDEQRER